ncbi:MAG: indole-3-glycerol phosphate synthase TrpC [Gemmatimonadota bacterium]|nr:indole-3-glycerol phosphate synthase TrpC [Gemmatimonadota bacterium]
MPNSKISRRATEVQGSIQWATPKGVLGELVLAAEARAAELRPRSKEIEDKALSAPPATNFLSALERKTVAVIAEVKRSSPSKGGINPGLDVAEQVAAYERGGAAAISILTEPSRFGGDIADLAAARAATGLPLLRKDFIVDVIQIAEARAAGASAVLLIARALDPSKLEELFRASVEYKLHALIEVRNESELERALSVGGAIIGVNNRNLETLEMDGAALELIPHIPRKCIAIAESGYRTPSDIETVARAGADAVLIGSELSASPNPAQLLAGFASINRSGNARPN